MEDLLSLKKYVIDCIEENKQLYETCFVDKVMAALVAGKIAKRFYSSLPQTSDVVVVGGGVIGASTAYHLAKRGLQVTLLERHKYVLH